MKSNTKKSWKKKFFLGVALTALVIGIFASSPGSFEDLQGKFIGKPVNKAEVIKMLVADSGATIVTSPVSCVWTDITGTEWYANYFYTACENGWLTSDFNSAVADPSGYYTKAQVAKIAYNVYGVANSVPSTPSFTDVASDTWYYEFVESLNSAGAFKKTSGEFRPDENPSYSFVSYITSAL